MLSKILIPFGTKSYLSFSSLMLQSNIPFFLWITTSSELDKLHFTNKYMEPIGGSGFRAVRALRREPSNVLEALGMPQEAPPPPPPKPVQTNVLEALGGKAPKPPPGPPPPRARKATDSQIQALVARLKTTEAPKPSGAILGYFSPTAGVAPTTIAPLLPRPVVAPPPVPKRPPLTQTMGDISRIPKPKKAERELLPIAPLQKLGQIPSPYRYGRNVLDPYERQQAAKRAYEKGRTKRQKTLEEKKALKEKVLEEISKPRPVQKKVKKTKSEKAEEAARKRIAEIDKQLEAEFARALA